MRPLNKQLIGNCKCSHFLLESTLAAEATPFKEYLQYLSYPHALINCFNRSAPMNY